MQTLLQDLRQPHGAAARVRVHRRRRGRARVGIGQTRHFSVVIPLGIGGRTGTPTRPGRALGKTSRDRKNNGFAGISPLARAEQSFETSRGA